MYAVVAIPLNRPDVRDFLLGRSGIEATEIEIIDQRTTPRARYRWIERLRAKEGDPSVGDLMAIDTPHAHLIRTQTNRLVPAQFLEEEGFLTRNLGGWTPIYFALVGVEDLSMLGDGAPDPMLARAEVLSEHGDGVRRFGADLQQVADRLEQETGASAREMAASFVRLHELDQAAQGSPFDQIHPIVAAIDGFEPMRTARGMRVPNLLLCEALLDRLVRCEQARRRAYAEGDLETVDRIEAAQEHWAEDYDVHLILKGEYVAGRHRRSTVCIAPSLGYVIKQPGPEPFHDIDMQARTYDGEPENWPVTKRDGAIVTPHGRIRIVLEEEVVPRLHAAFDHPVMFSSLLGLIREEYVPGPTLQEYVNAHPPRLDAHLYEEVLVTQQVCEVLGVNNPDWHSANFIVEGGDGRLVHIDWGASRPLTDAEKTPEKARERVEQVRNFAFSFQNDALAERTAELHDAITRNPDRMDAIRREAEAISGDRRIGGSRISVRDRSED